MWKCEWWRLYRTNNALKKHIRDKFPYRRWITSFEDLETIRKGIVFGYIQYDIEVPKIPQNKFPNFPRIFKNTFVSKNDMRDLMKIYAEEEDILSKPRKTLITPFLLLYLDLVRVRTKFYRFVENIPKNCFKDFVQPAVEARRLEDENPDSSVVAETRKFLANSSYGYQIMDRS